jgi:hypothetical protein
MQLGWQDRIGIGNISPNLTVTEFAATEFLTQGCFGIQLYAPNINSITLVIFKERFSTVTSGARASHRSGSSKRTTHNSGNHLRFGYRFDYATTAGVSRGANIANYLV